MSELVARSRAPGPRTSGTSSGALLRSPCPHPEFLRGGLRRFVQPPIAGSVPGLPEHRLWSPD
eukprot:7398000-Alexandrium_andersonii.AAC.1